MASLSLRISVANANSSVVKTIQFDPQTIVYDACRIIREKFAEAPDGNPSDYGLFLADEDPRKGVWLEAGRPLEYYLLRNQDLLEYKKKMRVLRVRMLDGAVKTLHVDDSHTVGQLMITICSKIGIAHHEEYSLVRDLNAEEKEKTMTLKRDKSIAKDQKKLDEMKKKLHTDDELDWLDHGKTLREQGVTTEETLLLRRKYFFSDQNVDARDPVQLNLLYVQMRDAIIKGAHPVTLEEAITFAAIQCQVQFGDHVESKHKSGFLDLKEFMPKEYVKTKGIEKKIFAEHRNLTSLSEVEARVKYTQMARSLKTYGITFFLVKEKMKGKNKLVPRLLGITKESVVRVDEKTKEILKKWPLTQVRRWAASPNSFTLDFGDYSDSYYSVQTTEGEQISQLIAGYIDIILKKQKAKDHLGIDGDEESTMFEDSVSPARATIIQHQTAKVGHANMESVALPAVMRAGGDGMQSAMTAGSLQKAQFSDLSMQAHAGYASSSGQNSEIWGLKPAQRGLLGTMESGMRAIKEAEGELERDENIPVGSDPGSQQWRENNRDLSKQKVGSQLSAMNAATAQVVTLTSADADETDYTAVGSAVQNIQSNIIEFSRDVRLLAALQDDQSDGDKLLDAARKLASAFSDLLNAAQPGSQEPRQNVLAAASRVGEAGHDIMIRVTDYETETDRVFEDKLLTLAKAVANATAVLVLKAKGVASKCENQPDQNRVISSATQCALSTSQLVACTKVVAPTIQNPSCQEQLAEAARQVARSVDNVADTAQSTCRDDNALQELGDSANAVQSALNDLLAHIKQGMATGQELDEVDNILTATERLYSTTEDPSEMIRQAKLLAQATSQLVSALTLEAESKHDSDEQRKLLAAAKVVADATARMVEAAKGCASAPHSKEQQQQLRLAAEDLREATTIALSVSLKRQVIRRLERAARSAASAATQLINASRGATPSNRNQASQHQLIMQCKVVGDESIPRLVRGIKGTLNDPDSPAAHLALISAAQDMLQPGGDLLNSSKAAIPTVGDQAASLSLSNAAKNFAAALSELRAASTRAQETCQSLEIDGALDQLRLLQEELEDMRRAVATGNLIPMPGDTAEEASAQLGASSKGVGSSMAQLLTAAAQGDENYTSAAAKDTANALRVFANSVRAVAATNPDREFQAMIIANCQDVINKSTALINEAKRAIANPNDPDNQQRLAQVAKAASQALNNCINCLPGLHEIDSSLRLVSSVSQRLTANQFPSSGRSFQEVQNQLNSKAASLNQAASDIVIVSSHGPPQQLAATSTRFGHEFENFMDTGLEMVGATREQETKVQVIGGLRNVSMSSTKLLMSSKSLLADPNAPNMKNQLTLAARAVTESINSLLAMCTTSAPGQKECDNALRQIQAVRPLLENPSEPLSDASYFECVDGVIEKSRALADAMTGISNYAKRAEMDQFCESVRNFASNVCGLTENAAQAAYLVGIADAASEPGRPGLIDQSLLARASQAIQAACESLTSTSNAGQQDLRAVVLSAATTVAKHTSALCNACRVASSSTNNPVAKRHFVQSAKDVANSTANLVRAIKALDSQFTEENRFKCAEAAKPLLEAVEELTTFASSPEFSSVLAKISPQARSAQEPITSAGKSLIDGACSMVLAAKQLAVNPKDPPTYQQYSAHSHTVSESIKRMVTALRENAPGQRECDSAIERINISIRDVNKASLAAISQSLPASEEYSMQGYQEQMTNSAKQLVDIIDALKPVAKKEAEKLGHLVSQVASFTEPLVQGAIGYASKTLNSKRQMNILDQTKTVTESLLQLLFVVKQAGGNPKSMQTHAAVDEAVEAAKEMLNELIQMLDELASAAGIVTNMIDVIQKAIDRTEERILVPENVSYVDFQTSMVRLAKQIAKHAQDIVARSATNPNELGNICGLMAKDYNQLATETKGALATTPSQEAGNRLKSAVQDLGTACIDLTKDAGMLQSNPGDSFSKKDVSLHARKVGEKVANVLSALQSGARGTQACINAASTISGIVADLDTTIMFASAGTLHSEPNENFNDHRESILKTAKALVEDTKTLVAGAASNQEQLASAAQNAVMTITKLAECVKHGASSLGSDQPEAQVMLINAIKDVTTALADLIEATKNASGKPSTDPAMGTLKEAAKTMVTNVTSLLKTVKTVEDETTRGTQALESSIEAIGQELKTYVSTDHVEKKLPAEELIRITKPITLATAKAVAAGNSGRQEDVIVAANMGRKAISDLLRTCKGAAANAETQDLQQQVLESGRFCSTAYKELLEQVGLVIQKQTPDGKQKLLLLSKKVAQAVTELVHAAELLKGNNWVDPNDPTAIAEAELLSAANQIEAAARKLTELQPRQKSVNMNLNFDEQILEAAKSIAAATSALVKAASAAQRELVAQGKLSSFRSDSEDNSQWSEGLVSAARLVAAATYSLCDAANAMVRGDGSEEKLISSAKQVASSTAQLLVACKVKADPDSAAMKRLQTAGNAVKRATEALVKAAQQLKEGWVYEEYNTSTTVSQRVVGGLAQVIMAQEEILIKERELESARRKLETIRRAKYRSEDEEESAGSSF